LIPRSSEAAYANELDRSLEAGDPAASAEASTSVALAGREIEHPEVVLIPSIASDIAIPSERWRRKPSMESSYWERAVDA
jgi:hypothetical protein